MPNVVVFPLQGDDGPDVRGGSGDILLVHATETDRKGTGREQGRAGGTAWHSFVLCPRATDSWAGGESAGRIL